MSQPQSIPPSERVPAPAIPFEPAQLRHRYDGWTADKQIRFIEALATSKCVDEACRIVGMPGNSADHFVTLPPPSCRAHTVIVTLTPRRRETSNEDDPPRRHRARPARRVRPVARRTVQGQARQIHEMPGQAEGVPQRQGPLQEV